MYNYFRIIIPRIILQILRLAKDITEKHTADGLTSKLNSLNMTLFISVYNQANAQNDLADQLDRDKETAIMERNQALGIAKNQYSYTPNTVKYYVYSIRDFLLGYFKGREQLMGDYGYTVNMSNGNVKVAIPIKPYDLLRLANIIIEKHTADGASSILNDFDMTAFEALYTLAQTKDNLAEKLKRDKETAFLVRNQLIGIAKGQDYNTPNTLLNFIVSTRDVLLGFYKGSEQILGDWGFEVNTSAPPPDPTPDPYILSGTVTSTVGATPIGNAMLTFNTSMGPLMTNTNPLGEYSLETPITEDESANVTIMAMGYQPYAAPIMLTPEGSGVFNFELTPE
ncbi:MAG: hypothetical protein Q8K70_04090 [Bacteroidota bacterium]|nr:hypothetical protein [Bacteroidota bacterium]